MQINIKIKNVLILIIFFYFITFFISCSVFQTLQPIQKLDYQNIDIKKFKNINHLTYKGISVTIPEKWMFIPPDVESESEELFRFISNDGNMTGVLQLLITEQIEEDKPQDGEEGKDNQNGNDRNNGENSGDNQGENNQNNGEKNINEETNSNQDGLSFQNDDELNNQNQNNNDDNEDNQNNNNVNTDNTNQPPQNNDENEETKDEDEEKEDENKIKPLNEYVEILLEEKQDYRYGWYLKRYDDRAKGFLVKIINPRADFVYYGFILDEREPKRLFRLVMYDKNLEPPTGTNPALNLSQEKVMEINEDLMSIFASVDLTKDMTILHKHRYDIGIKINTGLWKPHLDDTIDNVFYCEHIEQDALIQMKRLGYKYSDDKEDVINTIIQNFMINTESSTEDQQDKNGNDNGEDKPDDEKSQPQEQFTKEEITIDGIKAFSITARRYSNQFYPDKDLTIKKIFISIRDEIYEIAALYDGKANGLEDQINEAINNVYIKK